MCLALPGRIEQIETGSEPLMAKVDFGGVKKDVCLELVPDAAVGQYVIVHVGFALNTLDEAEALETIRLIHEIR